MSELPEGLLELMQCPRCGGTLTEREDLPALVCDACQVAFPIDDGGIPVMLEEAAVPLDK